MEKKSKLTSKKLIIIILAVFLVCSATLGVLAYLQNQVKQVAAEEDYGYVNPDETKAEPDAGITIDGVIDERVYQDNNWLYMRNDNGNATVDIAMTSYYGEKGMYFVYDVTESTPIYVNLDRNSAFNSCVELYLAVSDVTNMDRSEIFEIDLLPTGDIVFKQRNGKGAFMDVATTDDMMAYLGATTKGGEINTEDCYGYNLEFFIPWEYLDFLGLDVETMKTDYVFVNTAHITSYNYAGTAETDRYWYSFAQQLGGNGWGNVSLYYRFNKDGVIGTVPVELVQGEHYTIEGAETVIPGVKTHITITPEDGYAINSILVNGEEYIKKVSYNEDGSITFDVRGVKEGLEISASAEAVTEGDKTLSGTVKVHKNGGDSLNGVTASYAGPEGEKPITFGSNGNFTLTDLTKGYYTITVEKAGYEKIERGIYLNRNIDIELTLEYITFEVESGRCWQLEEVNDGIINKMGGFGSLLTADSYKTFSIEANFKYYQDVAESLDEQDRLEQRQGIRIKFSNDKYWHIDLLYQNEKYFIQYAKATTNSIFNFRDIYVLSEEEIAEFKSEDGIQLKVVRDGNRALIYLGGNLIAVEDLDKGYADLTAKVGFESWGPFTDVRTMEYKITGKVDVDVKNIYFGYHKAWDVTKQFEGVVSQPNGGNTVWLRFYEKIANMDLTFGVKDNPRAEGENPRTSIRFEFDNGETFIASICESAKGVVQIQKYPCTYTNNKWAGSYYNFTEAEKAQYKTEEGIDFRVVRNGTDILLFVGGEYKTCVDLSEIIKADTPAIVSIQHMDDKGVPYVMPFTMSEKLDMVTIKTEANDGKKLVTNKKEYVVGQEVVVEAEEGYYMNQVTINGKDDTANLNLHGTYDFIATEKEYTIKANVKKNVFGYSAKWNLLNQNQGKDINGATVGYVTLPEGGSGGGGGWLYIYDKYQDMDLTWGVQDHPGSDAQSTEAPRTTFEFVFDNGENLILSICENNKGVVQIQNLKSSINEKDYSAYYNFTSSEQAQYQTAEGINFRVVRNGTEFVLFIGSEYKTSIDLSEHVKADTKMTVRVRHNDDEGVEIKMPFAVKDTLTPVKITKKQNDKGSLKVLFAYNGTVVLEEDTLADSKYYLSAIKVDNTEVPLDENRKVMFTTTEEKHTIDGVYNKAIFENHVDWILTNQNQGTVDGVTSGTVSIKNGGYAGVLYLYRTTDKEGNKGFDYGDIDYTLTLRDYAAGASTPSTQIRFVFEIADGQKVLDLFVDESDGVVRIRNAQHNTMKIGSKTLYEFTEEEEASYKDAGIDVRVLREGKKISLYVGGEFKRSIDLSGHIENESMSRVAIFHDGDSGVQVDIPYKLSVPTKEWMGGQYLSILGDGISMSTGKPENSDNNTTTSKNSTDYIYGNGRGFGISSDWTKLYWGHSVVDNDLKLLVNNSVGGGRLRITLNETSQVAGYLRAGELHANTGALNGTEPDIIYVYMGTEDYVGENNADGFAEKYKATMDTITSTYKEAEVFCFTVMPYFRAGTGFPPESMITRMESYNNHIRDIASYYENVTLVDIEDIIKSTNYTEYYPAITFTCTMPNNVAHEAIAEVLQEALASQYAMQSSITVKTSDYGTITSDKTSCDFGETVVITAPKTDDVADGYYLDGLLVNGEVKAFDSDGTYTFTTDKVSYVIEGNFKKKIFKDDANWDLTKQNQSTANGVTNGMVALPNGGYGALWLYRSTSTSYDYGDIDLTLTLKDVENGSGTPVTQVDFILKTESSEEVFQLYVEEVDGVVKVGNKQHNSFKVGNNVYYELSEEEAAKYKGNGVTFRVLREGVKLSLYIDGDFKKSIYLDSLVESDTKLPVAIENNTMARVRIQHAGDEGVRVEIPYQLSFPQKESMTGKYVSILGDGISMSTGMPENSYNNSTTAAYNATDIYGNKIDLGIGSDWTKLYWGQSLVSNSMKLLVNNSVSKGLLHANPHTSTYGNDASKLPYYLPGYQRAGALHDNTDAGIANGTKPDIIYLYMGTEDRKQSNPTGFAAKYRETLNTIIAAYPDAEIFCFTTMAFYDNRYCGIGQTYGSSSARMTSVNNSIRTIASEYENVTLVDIADIITLENYKTYFPETVTRVAPNVAAHNIIAERLQKALESQFE